MSLHSRGILLTLCATFMFAIQDALTKELVSHMPVFQMAGLRCWLVFFIVTAWFIARGQLQQVMRVKLFWWQISRGLLLGSELVIFAWSMRYIGLGEMHTLFAAYPLMVTALSPWFLGEEVGWKRWIAIIVGFCGSVIVVSPWASDFSLTSLLGLVCALLFTFYNLITRRVGQHDSVGASFYYMVSVTALMMTPMMILHWEPFSFTNGYTMLGLGVTSITSHALLILALAFAPAALLQPFNYFTVPWAVLIGYVAFEERLAWNVWAGVLLVVGAGLFVAWRQWVLQQSQASD